MSDCDHSQPWTHTILPNGHGVWAFPEENGTDRNKWHRAHDRIHLIVAKAAGLPTSPALERATPAGTMSDHGVALEEAAIKAVTDWLEYLEEQGCL